MRAGEVAPLECNLDALAGISYSKGCYIGQERNSYTHYRGIIRRRLMPVALPGLASGARALPGEGVGWVAVGMRARAGAARSQLLHADASPGCVLQGCPCRCRLWRPTATAAAGGPLAC